MRLRDSVYIVPDDLETVPPEEVAASAARLGLSFPDGRTEFMAELGEGCSCVELRIWTSSGTFEELPEHRAFLAESFFRDEEGPPSPERARATIPVGDTVCGHLLVFHPVRPDELFVLPRDEG